MKNKSNKNNFDNHDNLRKHAMLLYILRKILD